MTEKPGADLNKAGKKLYSIINKAVDLTSYCANVKIMSTSQCQLPLRIKKDARLRNYCVSPTTVNTRIISWNFIVVQGKS